MVTDTNRNAGTDHDRVEELLSALQDGAATPAEEALVARHLAGCVRCRATAAAYQRVNERVVAYLRATPVPELTPTWRAAADRPAGRWTIGGGRGGLRVALVGVATILLLLLGTSAIVQRAGNRAGQTAESRADAGQATGATAPARSAAGATAAATTAAAAMAPAPTAAAAAATTSAPPPAAAAAAAGPTTVAAQPAAPPAPAAATRAATTAPSAAGGAAPPAGTAPAAAPAAATRINPVQRYGLASAASLTLCLPLCEAEPRPEELREAVVRALDRDLAPAGPPREPGGSPITLQFALGDGRLVDIVYDRGARLLRLPDGGGYLVAPPELADALAGLISP